MNHSKRMTGLIVAVLLTGCGGPLTYAIPATAKAPGADGKVSADVKKDQGVTLLQFSATNLAPPDRIVPGAKSFILWWRRGDATPWTRIGTLRYDEAARKGDLSGSVPETSFGLEVSCEDTVQPGAPSGDIVFMQQVN